MSKEGVRRVLVTGASRGIGRSIASSLASQGFEVGIHYRSSAEAASSLLDEIKREGGRGFLLSFDVSDRGAVRQVLHTTLSERGAFWGVVLNAGIVRDDPFPAMSDDAWDEVLRTNLDGFFNVIQPLVMPMIQLRDGGRIVVMSSVSGLAGNRGQCNYSASKGGLIAASKALAREVAKRRITVNCVAPGIIATEMTEGVPEEAIRSIPMRRQGKPEEVASLVAYLFSEGAGYLTAETIGMHGGLL